MPAPLFPPARLGLALAVAVVLLVSLPAQASSPGLHLTPALGALEPTRAPAALQPASPSGEQPWTIQFLAGAGATVVAVPAGLYLGTLLGSLTNNLVLAALPPLLLFAALPPLAVTWAEWLVGNLGAEGRARFQPALWVALGVHVLAIVGAVAFGVSTLSFGTVAVLTLAEALLLPAAVTLTMRLTPGPPTALAPRAPEPLAGREPMPRVPSVPLVAFAF
jgi:hypothetical protein